MFKSLFLWLELTCGTDPTAVIVMGLMCSVGAYMTRGAMANPNGAFIIYPVLLTFSILANWIFSQYGFFEMKKMDQWLQAVISSSALGMTVGLTLFIMAYKSVHALIDRKF